MRTPLEPAKEYDMFQLTQVLLTPVKPFPYYVKMGFTGQVFRGAMSGDENCTRAVQEEIWRAIKELHRMANSEDVTGGFRNKNGTDVIDGTGVKQ